MQKSYICLITVTREKYYIFEQFVWNQLDLRLNTTVLWLGEGAGTFELEPSGKEAPMAAWGRRSEHGDRYYMVIM